MKQVTQQIHDPIDVLELYARGHHKQWNAYLTRSHATGNVRGLVDTMRRIEAGMDRVVKQGLNTEELVIFFVRLQRSIENTLKKIYRDKHVNPLYNPANKAVYDKFIMDKRAKDNDFERFLKRERY